MKKSLVYSVFAIILVSFSCQKLNSPDKPDNLIAEDKMVEILTDIAFVKAAKGSYKKVFDIQKINPESYILEKHGIDSLVFEANNNWYTSQLDQYEEIFKKVKSNIEISKIKFEKLKKEEDSLKKISDSIKKIKNEINDYRVLSEDLDELESIKEELMDVEKENAVRKRTNPSAVSGKKKQ
ncbi:DUF4296 domain-containing protein [Aquimarina sp. AD1]|uniref:DUF4296 domain-containing protein n=1 Tax=Aquimarina TaxID=290174 RepID=UPI00041F09EF|nr:MULTISPECIES: DUF4296 domain-containing protein [Aquimarina]AXT56946.1 DUF4296 domain-containing protein [Aquimarina sp. AD1]RKN16457.1 DUF4296 domain-containing protein [Aquimarina sp. AD1]